MYNILLIAYAFAYKKTDVFDDSIVYLFPTLKAIFLWLNLEFALRYVKSAQIMKLMFDPDPIKQIRAQEPASVRKRIFIECSLLLLLILLLITETSLITYGFVCIDNVIDSGNSDFDDNEKACRRYVKFG